MQLLCLPCKVLRPPQVSELHSAEATQQGSETSCRQRGLAEHTINGMGGDQEQQKLRLGILSAAGSASARVLTCQAAPHSSSACVCAGIAKKNVRGLQQNTKGIGEHACVSPPAQVQPPGHPLLCAAEVVAVASRSLEKAQAFIDETELKGTSCKALGSYDELIADKSIDALYVAGTPALSLYLQPADASACAATSLCRQGPARSGCSRQQRLASTSSARSRVPWYAATTCC